MNDGRPLTLALSPQTGRGDTTPSPARAGEGWGGVALGYEGGRKRYENCHFLCEAQ